MVRQYLLSLVSCLLLTGGGAAKALGKKNANVQTLEGIATNIGLIGAAIVALPKGLVAVGIIGFLLGNAIYKDTPYSQEIKALAQDIDNVNNAAQNVEMSFSTSMMIANNPYGAIRDMAKYATDEQNKLNGAFEDGYLGLDNLNNELNQTDGISIGNEVPSFFDDLAGRIRSANIEAMEFKEATIEILEIELGELKRFGAAQEDIDAIAEQLRKLKIERGDIIDDDDDDDDTSDTKIEDFVGDFFASIEESIKKEAARLDLQNLGLSEALIEQILGASGWDEVFEAIIDGGESMARQLQEDFNKTAAGITEMQEAAEELAAEQERIAEEIADLNQQIVDTQAQQTEAVAKARQEFDDFTESLDFTVDALQTYEREVGNFERQTRSDLQRIEGQIRSAFDNGYLLEEARDNLLEYARAELNTLARLQRQRDRLLGQRNAAADTIFGVAEAVTSAGNITQLLRDVQDEVEEVEVTELFEGIVQSADKLNGFKVTLERNFTEVVTNTVSKSQQLVNGFQAVVDRTRAFIDNLQLLREMGLDPFLFNQLVEAGAEAGGATAQALVEGGADTVNEVNQLQRRLEEMGVELGEQTYEVTKNSGEQFVSGIVDGLDAQLQTLEEQAIIVAQMFTDTFSTMMSQGLDAAFEQIAAGIKSEFDELIEELRKRLEETRAMQQRVAEQRQGYTDPVTVVQGGSTSTAVFDPITGELLRSYTAPTDSDLISGGIVNPDYFADYLGTGMGPSETGNTIINNIINANNPLDAYNASKGNVEQQSVFQSSNGSIQTTLSGVGN